MIDEIGFIPKWFLEKVVFPIKTNGPPFLSITTKNEDQESGSGKDNPVNEYVEMNKEEKFMQIYESMKICEDCRAKGVTEPCDCGIKSFSGWTNQRHVAFMAKVITNKDVAGRELYGISGMSNQKMFHERDVIRFRDELRIVTDKPPRFINVSIDPAAEGDGSMFAIVTTYYHENRVVVKKLKFYFFSFHFLFFFILIYLQHFHDCNTILQTLDCLFDDNKTL